MKTKTNNERLRELIEESGLTQALALTIINRGMGARPYSMSTLKGYLVDPKSDRFRPLSDELLAHCERQFAKLAKGS